MRHSSTLNSGESLESDVLFIILIFIYFRYASLVCNGAEIVLITVIAIIIRSPGGRCTSSRIGRTWDNPKLRNTNLYWSLSPSADSTVNKSDVT